MRVEVKLGVWRNEEHDYKRQIVLEDMKMFLLVKVMVVHEGGGGDSEWNGNLCTPTNIKVLCSLLAGKQVMDNVTPGPFNSLR